MNLLFLQCYIHQANFLPRNSSVVQLVSVQVSDHCESSLFFCETKHRLGSQQYTAHSLTFQGCMTAVQMVWDWGFTWQNVSNVRGN
jgi:hypothetical protein